MSDPSTPPPVGREALRVLAHPLRSRLLAELRTMGPATATDLARALDTNSGATSYHLRRLADAGLVAPGPPATGRRRVWEAADERALELGLVEDTDEDAEAALDWLALDYVAHFSDKAATWVSARTDWTPEWQDSCGLDDRLVLVTEAQLAALQEEIAGVLERYRRVGAGNPQARRVTYYTCALPVDPPSGRARA